MPTILVILPVLPQPSYAESMVQSLSFLHSDYALDYVDPFDISHANDRESYYQDCRSWLQKTMLHYDAVFGFSFGGVILQQCFDVLEPMCKPIVLFSTPTFADETLLQKLGRVIELCEANVLDAALQQLYAYVLSPHRRPPSTFPIDEPKVAVQRLSLGLRRVLETSANAIFAKTHAQFLHCIGEESQLVNRDNVSVPKSGRLVVVPKAGMHVLQDNASVCQPMIWQALRDTRFFTTPFVRG